MLHEELLQQGQDFHVVVDDQQSAHGHRVQKKGVSKTIARLRSYISTAQHFYSVDITPTFAGKQPGAPCRPSITWGHR
jgi:hypothetical protein